MTPLNQFLLATLLPFIVLGGYVAWRFLCPKGSTGEGNDRERND